MPRSKLEVPKSVTVSDKVRLEVKLPRPKGKRGLARAKLEVPSLTVIRGVVINSAFTMRTRELAGWRLYLNVDDHALFDGEALSAVDQAFLATMQPVRGKRNDPLILTTRDEPVEVVLGVEWRGRGKPRRLPKGVEVVINGHR